MLPETNMEGGQCLGVGIDWAEEFHLVALGRPGEGVIEVVRVEHRPQAVAALVERIAGTPQAAAAGCVIWDFSCRVPV